MQNKAWSGFAAAFILALAMTPALAQDEAHGDYARMWRFDVMPGKSGEFTKAFNTHLKWRRDHGETWTWIAYRPVTGEHVNSLYVRSGEHTLADLDAYDAFDAKAGKHWSDTVDQYVQSYGSWIMKGDENLEVWPDDLEPTLIQAYTYHLKPGGHRAFDAAVKKIHEGLVKVKWGEPYAITRVVSGSPGDDVVVVFPYENYADMAEPEKSFDAALAEAWGKDEAGRLMKDISGSYESTDEVLVRFDPDSSLILEN